MRTCISALSLVLVLGPAAGCSTQPSGMIRGGDRPVGASYREPVYLSPAIVEVRREYLDRYACLNGFPLICACRGRVSATCDCHCPPH